MGKKIKALNWTPVQIDGSVFSGGAEDLIGIEVCEGIVPKERAPNVSFCCYLHSFLRYSFAFDWCLLVLLEEEAEKQGQSK